VTRLGAHCADVLSGALLILLGARSLRAGLAMGRGEPAARGQKRAPR
jgi:hypothetical protein